MTTNMKIFEDMEFVVEYFPSSHYVEYKIYQFGGLDSNGVPLLVREDCTYGVGTEHAEVFVYGSVKWDGCSNWEFNQETALHGCTRDDLVNLGEILAQCWDMTKDLCPNWSD